MEQKTSITIGGKEISFETGKLAPQADAAVVGRCGDTVVLVTVVASKSESALPYFPLQVEYGEKLYAGGRIKGSRWVKREGRPSDDLILNARLIDRSIRPLFPKEYHHDVQIVITVLSVDKENDPDMLALQATSCALAISQIPWNGPIGGVRVGRVNDELIVNPTAEQMETSTLDLVVSGTADKAVMIEAGAHQLSEELMMEALKRGNDEIKRIIDTIRTFAKKIGKKKQMVVKKESSKLHDVLTKEEKKTIIDLMSQKAVKKEGAAESLNEFSTKLIEKYGEKYEESEFANVIDELFEQHARKQVIEKKVRIDGRKLDEIRPLSAEVGVLPRTHGSAIFQRGNTQALTITTLGAPSMEQYLETAEGEETKRYMHHYNMPPFSVGETGRMGWPSRREIGHGALAERALLPVVPSREKFPYTIHLVSEVLSSNGSTSMASTCGSTLSLMDAGVPIETPVAGISVGLVTEGDRFELLTDIMGVEDFTGDMDFKVAGTHRGVTAIQLDVKIPGLTYEMVEKTFERAKEARAKILEVMNKAISSPRQHVSTYAPKIETVTIPTEKIGEIIGPGGKMIRNIIATTGCDVDVNDDGVVTISSQEAEKVKKAAEWIKGIVREVQPGEMFNGVVTRMMPFGAFVEVLPGKEGLVHLSQMSTEYVKSPEDVVHVGQKVQVQVIEIDEQGRINLSMLSKEERESKRQNRNQGHGNDRTHSHGNGRSSNNGGNRRDRRPYQHPHLKENR